MHIHDGNKSPLKFLGKAAVGVVRDSGKFSGHPWRIARSRSSFAIAQLSCYQVTLVFTSITCKRCVHACYNVCTLCIGLCSPCSPWPTVRRNGDWLKFTCKNSLQFSLHFDGCYIYCLAHLAEEHRPMSKLNIMMSIKKTDFLSLMYANVLVQTLYCSCSDRQQHYTKSVIYMLYRQTSPLELTNMHSIQLAVRKSCIIHPKHQQNALLTLFCWGVNLLMHKKKKFYLA